MNTYVMSEDDFEGVVESGLKEAREYLGMVPYQQKLKDICGFQPFPGTLNVRTDVENVVRLSSSVDSQVIDSFEWKGEEFSGLKAYPIELGGIEAYYIDIEITDHGESVMEIISSVKLREELSLEDGDKVQICF